MYILRCVSMQNPTTWIFQWQSSAETIYKMHTVLFLIHQRHFE